MREREWTEDGAAQGAQTLDHLAFGLREVPQDTRREEKEKKTQLDAGLERGAFA